MCIALLETPLLAVIVALLTRFVPDDGYSLLANKNLVSYIFMAVIVATFTGLSISAEEIIKDRTLLKRERFLRLSRGSYLSSKMFYLLCISAIQSLLFIVVGNLLIGIGSEMFLTWWITLWATSFLANLTGCTIAILKLDRSDLYNDTAAFNPADLTLRLSCQVRRFEQERIQPEHSAPYR